MIVFKTDPMGKPRMTQSDKWKKRKVTDRYWQMKDFIRKVSADQKFEMPLCLYHMIFVVPMPDSWPRKKKEIMNKTAHQQKPDKDNMEKAVLDAMFGEDKRVFDGRVSKFWGYAGLIIIYKMQQ